MDALSRYPFMTVFHWCLLELSHWGFVVGPAWEVIGIPMTAGTVH